MQHSYDVEIAVKYGINQAIILNNLFFWIQKNEANGKHFYDGHYWTYNSKKAFSELLPYMTERQIDYALTKLTKDGLILKGNYNKLPYDRTLWYALTDKAKKLLKVPVKSISQNCKMYQTNLQNGNNENVRPIPDINSDINSDINKERTAKKRFTPPTTKEVSEYCIERGNNIDPEQFVAFYESKGWKVGNNHMKDWKSAIITWEKREKNPKKKSKQQPQSYSIEDFASYNIFESMEE